MSTAYVHRLTVAVPEVFIEIANHLAVAIGESSGDFETFSSATWQDAEGNLFAVASLQCTDTLFALAGTPLERRDFAPEDWDASKATQAQSLILLWMGDGDPPSAEPSRITGLVMDDVRTAIEILGVELESD